MNKTIIYIIIGILICSFVSAISLTNENLLFYYKMDEASGSLIDSKTNSITNYPLLGFPTLVYQQPKVVDWSTYSIGFDGDSACFWNDSAEVKGWFNQPFAEGFSIGGSFNANKYQDQWIMSAIDYNVGTYEGAGISLTVGGLMRCGFYTNGDAVTAPYALNKNYSFICNYNKSGDINFYLRNDTESPQFIGNIGDTYDNTAVARLSIGCADHQNPGTSMNFFSGNISDVWMINRTIDQTEAFDILSNGIGAAATITATPTIVAPSPVDNSNNNTNVTLNATHPTLLNEVRYYLYFSDTTPSDEGDYYLFNVTRDGDEYKSFLTNVSDGTYYWKWKVQNITNGIFSGNTTQRTLTIDTVKPTITRLTNNNWKIDNSTILSPLLINLTLNLSFADESSLYQSLINLTYENGTSYYNRHNISITGTTDNFSTTIDIGSFPIGNYTLLLADSDPHTALSISAYDDKIGLLNNYIEYKTEEGITLRIESEESFIGINDAYSTKLKDRYNFGWKFYSEKESTSFLLSSDMELDYITDSIYPAHFVAMNGLEGNWIDFNLKGKTREDYVVKKIDDYNYRITINNANLKDFQFESVGGLNIKEEHYKIRLGAVLDVWAYDEENPGIGLNITAVIGTQSADGTGNVSGARLVNITKEISTVTLNSISFGAEVKSFTILVNQTYYNLSYNMTPTNAVKMYFYDESSNSLITGETISVFLETTGFSNDYSIDTSTDNPYTITGLGSGTYQLKASSTNYPQREYKNLEVSNITSTNLNIYLINSTDSSQISFQVVDTNGDELDNTLSTFKRIINGSSTIVAEEYSDYAGTFKLYLDENYEYYINFSKTNYNSKIISLEPSSADSPYTITMQSASQVVAPIIDKFRTLEIHHNLTYTIDTRLITFQWNDISNTASHLCLDVLTLNQTYNAECSILQSGTLTYTLPDLNISFLAKAIATKNGRNYTLDTKEINRMAGWQELGDDSLIVAMIVFLTIGFLGLFSPVAAVIMGTFALIGLYFMGILPIGFGTIGGIVFVAIIIIIVSRMKK